MFVFSLTLTVYYNTQREARHSQSLAKPNLIGFQPFLNVTFTLITEYYSTRKLILFC